MIGVLLISSIFIILLLIAVLLVAFHIKYWSKNRDKYYIQKHNELQQELNELKRLFMEEINETLNHIKQILK
jgi:sensor domain CHASE-containing protein